MSHSEKAKLYHRDWQTAGLIALLALAVRLIFLFGANDRAWPHSIYYEGDAPLWAEWAATLDRGESFQHNLPIWPPGVAYLMHWITPSQLQPGAPMPSPASACGRDFTRLKIFWCLLSAFTWAIAYLVIAGEFGRSVGLIAAGLGTFSFSSYVLATSLNNETPYLFLLILIIACTNLLVYGPRTWLGLTWGVLNAAACFFRPEHPLCVLLLSGWIILGWLRRNRKSASAAVLAKTQSAPYAGVAAFTRPNVAWTALAAGFGFIATLAPWMLHSHRAAVRQNSIAEQAINFDAAIISWQPDARQFVESMPAFARFDNFEFVTDMLAQARKPAVTASDARQLLLNQFGALPEPIATWSLVSMQGPLSFALANHPRADGGFSKAALELRSAGDSQLHLAQPWHLNLVNHGYGVGWGWIQHDPRHWMNLVGRKLANFRSGIGQGFGASNFPVGRAGVRRAVDLVTPAAPAWSVIWGVGILVGLFFAIRRRVGGVWLLVIIYKLIITVLFYGYARQAASIEPAFCLLVALALADGCSLLRWNGAATKTPLRIAVALLVIAIVGFDIFAARQTAVLSIRGLARTAPEWAPNAILSPATIELRWSNDPPNTAERRE